MALSGAEKPPVANFLYRHVIMNDTQTDMLSNCGDIFNGTAAQTYFGNKIILMIRDPLDRLESEFGFLGNRDVFRNLWKHNTGLQFPSTFQEFVSHPATANSICKFLLGFSLYGDSQIHDSDYELIIKSLDELDFVYGLTSDMGLTVQNVEHRCSISISNNNELPRYRTSLYKPKRGDDWDSIETTFNKLNQYDIKLVNQLAIRFQKQIDELPAGRTIKFNGDIYDSVYLFLNGEELRSPLEIYANDLDNPEQVYAWIKERKNKLNPVLAQLMPQFNGDGKALLNAWLEQSIPTLLSKSTQLNLNENDPLETLRELTSELFSSLA